MPQEQFSKVFSDFLREVPSAQQFVGFTNETNAGERDDLQSGVWVDKQRVAFIGLQLKMGFSNELSGVASKKYYDDWQNLIHLVNHQSPAGMRLGLQISPYWVKAEVEQEFLRGVYESRGR